MIFKFRLQFTYQKSQERKKPEKNLIREKGKNTPGNE